MGDAGHGGLIVIEDNAASRCGISMKGCDIVVGGDVGHVSAFMAQDDVLQTRLDVEEGARRVRNYLNVMTMELTTLARACGKSNVHNLEREDLVALTVEAAAMAKIPLAGTHWIPGLERTR